MLKFLDFSLCPRVKHFADRRTAVFPCCEKPSGKPDARLAHPREGSNIYFGKVVRLHELHFFLYRASH